MSYTSCVESSDTENNVSCFVKNKRYRYMRGPRPYSSESDGGSSSQLDGSSTSADEEDEPVNFGRYAKRARRCTEMPFQVYRYTPDLKIARIRDMGRKHDFQNEIILMVNSIRVNENFCMCTSGGIEKSNQHMRNTFYYFEQMLSPRRFLYVLFSFIYLFTMRQTRDWHVTVDRKYVCHECTMITWWSKSCSYSDMIMYLYNQYVTSQRCTEYMDIVCSIDRYLLKKHSDAFMPHYVDSLYEYVTEETAHMYVDKVAYLLARYGHRLCDSNRNFENNLFIKLMDMCKNYLEFNDLLDVIEKYLPTTLYQTMYIKTLRQGLFDDVPLLHTFPMEFVWNENLSNKLMQFVK